MPNYRELHHKRALKKGVPQWVEPTEKRTVNMDKEHAEEHNAQFENTGILYEPENEKTTTSKNTK